MTKRKRATTWLLACTLASAGASAMGARVAHVDVAGATLNVQPLADADLVTVSVTGPEGYALTRSFGRGQTPQVTLADGATTLRDGLYLYEVTLGRAGAARSEAAAGGVPGRQVAGLRQAGHFTVAGGRVLLPNTGAKEPGAERPAPSPDDFLISDDLVVVGSTCSGFDCVNGEAFGSENLLLKQNNNRIRADDTSAAAGFPNNDWELRFNDDFASGLNRFALVDVTGSKIPMSVLAGAPTDSLVVDAAGNVGVGTAAPAAEVHVKDGDTPTLRLDQDGSSGFTPQAWDVAGNEANFFVRDVNAGTVPLRIRSGAPSEALAIAGTSGDVGVGTGAPTASLHVKRDTGSTRLLIEETSATTASRNMLRVVNNGASTFRFDTTTGLPSWGFGSLGTGNFFITGTGVVGLSMQMTNSGNMTILGTLTQLSDRNAKEGIETIDAADVLNRVEALPLSTWSYKNDQGKIRHLGPMAQDFAAAFGLGPDDTHVAPSDVAGVSLAAVQGLNRKLEQRLQEKDAEIEALEARLAALEALVRAAAR